MVVEVYVVGWYDFEERKSKDRIFDRRYFGRYENAMAMVREQVRAWLYMWGKMDVADVKVMDDAALRAAIDAKFPDNNVPWTELDIPTTVDGSSGKYREYLVDACGDEIGFITKVDTLQ